MEITSVDKMSTKFGHGLKDFREIVLSKIKAMKTDDRVMLDISKISPVELQRIVNEIQEKVWTYISLGTLVIQKK